MTTKAKLMEVYRNELVNTYKWASNPDSLNRYMKGVEDTLNGKANSWLRIGEAYTATLEACGLPKRISLQRLRELPAE